MNEVIGLYLQGEVDVRQVRLEKSKSKSVQVRVKCTRAWM